MAGICRLPLRGSEAVGRKRLTLAVLSACTASVTSGYTRGPQLQVSLIWDLREVT